jgi:serine/threonine-protein kinase RsbW
MPDDTETQQIDTYLDSELESADEAENLVVGIATDAGFPEEELHKIGMAVRESIVNAVVHGNRYNRRKRVHLAVKCTAGQLRITIGDEGEGFDVNSLPDPVADHNLLQQSGRGIFLIKAFVDEFSVRKLNPGTEVTLVKYRQ